MPVQVPEIKLAEPISLCVKLRPGLSSLGAVDDAGLIGFRTELEGSTIESYARNMRVHVLPRLDS